MENRICGKKGWLVWDYIIWNELTFEDFETGKKLRLMTSLDDEAIQKQFEVKQ